MRRAAHLRIPADVDRTSDWHVVESGLDAARTGAAESVFAVGNGYLGVRGSPEEGAPAHAPGVMLEGTPADRYPLLLHYHPLEIFRHQVIKQTDVVLATYLVEHHFSAEETRRTFDYYDPLTTGDSTLSACIQSVVASAVGYPAAALDYFLAASSVDLHDTHGNTADGIHVASCGGTWLALVAGFGGLRDFDGRLRFHPRLPAKWGALRFRLQSQGQLVEVSMTPEGTSYELLDGDGLLVEHFGEDLHLAPGRPVRRAAGENVLDAEAVGL